MIQKIDRKIVDFEVLDIQSSQEIMNENLERPETLTGRTYKVKTPVTDYAIFVTINDVILNEGTSGEVRRPFEIFINSKNMEHFQWMVAVTRIMSAVFRKGGDVTFLVEELHSVFDPKGGYFKKGGHFIPSLVAELGVVLEEHLAYIGMVQKKEKLQKDIPGAIQCPKCHDRALIKQDGCEQCMSCGYSRCG